MEGIGMAKFGVGVGEEFPVDETKPKDDQQGAGDKPRQDAGSDREERDDPCHAWHERHADWHRRWRDYARGNGRGSGPQFWRALFIIGGIAMLIAIISHFFYFILGAAVLAVLYALHRHHGDAMWDIPPSQSK